MNRQAATKYKLYEDESAVVGQNINYFEANQPLATGI
jgi:hypothetical protein